MIAGDVRLYGQAQRCEINNQSGEQEHQEPVRSDWSEYRVWRFMRHLATRGQVMDDIALDRKLMEPSPGVLSRAHLEALAEQVVGDVSMLVRFSPGNAFSLMPEKYRLYEARYSSADHRRPWRPWNSEKAEEISAQRG